MRVKELRLILTLKTLSDDASLVVYDSNTNKSIAIDAIDIDNPTYIGARQRLRFHTDVDLD